MKVRGKRGRTDSLVGESSWGGRGKNDSLVGSHRRDESSLGGRGRGGRGED